MPPPAAPTQVLDQGQHYLPIQDLPRGIWGGVHGTGHPGSARTTFTANWTKTDSVSSRPVQATLPTPQPRPAPLIYGTAQDRGRVNRAWGSCRPEPTQALLPIWFETWGRCPSNKKNHGHLRHAAFTTILPGESDCSISQMRKLRLRAVMCCGQGIQQIHVGA